MLKLTNDIMETIDSGKIAILTTLDMSATFDTVDHDTLLHRLQHTFGQSGFVISWIRFVTTNQPNRLVLFGSQTFYSPSVLFYFTVRVELNANKFSSSSSSYLTNRSSFVKTDSSSSPSITILAGVPQGSVLGPLLLIFVLFISSIAKVINSDQSNQNNIYPSINMLLTPNFT